MKKKWFGKVSVMLAAVLMLSACGAGGGGGSDKEAANASEIEKKYPGLVEHEGTPVDGGTLKVAVVSDS